MAPWLRHTAITEALETNGRNVRAVQRFLPPWDVRAWNATTTTGETLGRGRKQVAASVPGENLSL